MRKTGAVAMLALFANFYLSTHLFPHAHAVQGRTVTHSHLYKTTHHDHNTAELELIRYLSDYLLLLAVFLFLGAPARRMVPLVFRPELHHRRPPTLRHYSLRGPPATV